jgi:hypothetical protein
MAIQQYDLADAFFFATWPPEQRQHRRPQDLESFMYASQLFSAEVGDSEASPRTDREPGVTLCRTGEYWTLEFSGRVVHLRDSKGLVDLARLLGRPGEEFHVLELIEERGSQPVAARALAASLQEGLSVKTRGAWDQPIDARARAAYRTRYVELVAELEEAQSHNDMGRAQRSSDELSQLVGQLQQRGQVACAATERARKAVYNRLRAAIARVARQDRALGCHLEVTVKTGIVCSYRPERARYCRA